jgi:TolB protein
MRGAPFFILILLLLACSERENPAEPSPLKEYKIAAWAGPWVLASVFTVSIDSHVQLVLADSIMLSDSTLSWTPDGSKVLFTSDWQVHVVNSDGTRLRKLSSGGSKDAFAVWSPEGFRIALQSEKEGRPDIYVMNSDGSSPKRLTNSARGARMPSWSRDGEQIAYMGDGGIHVVGANGTGDRQVTNYADDFRPLWSPVGTKILFRSRRDGNSEVYIMNPDGSGQINISRNPSNDEDHAWSPDGNEIVFVSDRDSGLDEQDHFVTRRELYVVNVDGTRLTRITHNSYAFSPTWSPSGLWIAFEDRLPEWGGVSVLTIISSAGGGKTWLPGGFSPVWSPVRLP